MALLTPCTPDQIRSLVDGYQIYSWQGYDCAMLKDGRIVLVCESGKAEPAAQKSSPAAKERAIREAAATILSVVAEYLCRRLRGSD